MMDLQSEIRMTGSVQVDLLSSLGKYSLMQTTYLDPFFYTAEHSLSLLSVDGATFSSNKQGITNGSLQ